MYKIALFLLAFSGPVLAALTHGSDYANPPSQYPLRANSSGQISQTLQAGEDRTNDVQVVEHQYLAAIDDADLVVKASPGFLHSVWCFAEDAAATAGTVRITNSATTGAAETTEVWGDDFAAAAYSPRGAILDIEMSTGIVIDFTTTADVKCGVSYR